MYLHKINCIGLTTCPNKLKLTRQLRFLFIFKVALTTLRIAASPGLTLLSIIGDGLQVYEMRADNGGFNGIIVAQLDLNPLA